MIIEAGEKAQIKPKFDKIFKASVRTLEKINGMKLSALFYKKEKEPADHTKKLQALTK